jgi:hypothetical protein
LAAFAAIPANAQTAGALSLAWTDPLPGGNIATYQPTTHPNGAVSLLYADPVTSAPTVKTVGADREQLSTVRPSGESFVAVGKNGDAYFAATSKLTARASDGATRWTAILPDACGSPTYPQNVTVGADGSVYALAVPPVANRCAGSFQLVKYNALTGANDFAKAMGDWPTTYSVAAYKTGVAVQQEKTVRYFDASGAETDSFAGPSTDVRVNADGTAIYALSHMASASDGCTSTGPLVEGILFRTTAGAQVQANLHDCTEAYWMQPLSNGGALINELGGGAGTLVGVSASGAVMWRKAYPAIVGDTSRIAYLTAKSDGNGNIVVVQQTVTGNRYAVDVQVVDASTGATQASFNTGSLDATASFLWMSASGVPDSIGVTPNRLYLTLAKCVAGASCDAGLYAFDLNGLSLDYPRGAVWGIGGQDPGPTVTPTGPGPTQKPKLNYVALGDSFSSGEGVPPFRSPSDKNGCHRSTGAYPEILSGAQSTGLHLLPYPSPKSTRPPTTFVACSGATTQSLANGRNGEPGQLDVLSKTTDIVTLTVGGNNIGFADFAAACVLSDCDVDASYVRARTKIRFDLPNELNALYERIRAKISINARVLVIGYPMIVPDARIVTAPNCGYLTASEKNAARTLVTQLNAAIKTAVNRINNVQLHRRFEYVDPNYASSPFTGHELCMPDSYFNGLYVPTSYMLHPNAKGQAAYAGVIAHYMFG